jgi:hypothetical protein
MLLGAAPGSFGPLLLPMARPEDAMESPGHYPFLPRFVCQPGRRLC